MDKIVPADMMDKNVPRKFCLALFKGTRPGIQGIYNRIGRFIDRGPYSHSELVFTNGISGSASFLDKGVRLKKINYSSVGNWDFLPIPGDDEIEVTAWEWFQKHNGKKYDVMGNLRFATNFARDDNDKWFCSEASAAALGIPEPYRYGPSGLATMLRYLYKTDLIIVEDKYPH